MKKSVKDMIETMRTTNEPLTYGDTLRPCADVETKAEAQEYFNAMVEYMMNVGKHDYDTAFKMCQSNIGYWSGYYGTDEMARIQELFDVSHPIFGKTIPTPKEALEAGMRAATAPKKQGA